jgi:hypothetical protein
LEFCLTAVWEHALAAKTSWVDFWEGAKRIVSVKLLSRFDLLHVDIVVLNLALQLLDRVRYQAFNENRDEDCHQDDYDEKYSNKAPVEAKNVRLNHLGIKVGHEGWLVVDFLSHCHH